MRFIQVVLQTAPTNIFSRPSAALTTNLDYFMGFALSCVDPCFFKAIHAIPWRDMVSQASVAVEKDTFVNLVLNEEETVVLHWFQASCGQDLCCGCIY